MNIGSETVPPDAGGAGRTAPRPGWALRALGWTFWPAILTGPSILLHEGAHLVVALAVGVPDPVLHYSAISHGDLSDVPDWAIALTSAAGPLMTIVLGAAGCWFISRKPPPGWAFGLAAVAASRLLLGLPFALLGIISVLMGYGAESAFDEFKAATAVGLPGLPFVALSAACGVAACVLIARRTPRAERSAAWPGIVIGSAMGWAAWLLLLGPVLLP